MSTFTENQRWDKINVQLDGLSKRVDEIQMKLDEIVQMLKDQNEKKSRKGE